MSLLPLYDGLDELPVEDRIRETALDAMAKFTQGYVLSSRSGHGVEKVKAFASEHTRELHELSMDDAEQFICRRLNNLKGRQKDQALVAYRRAQPHIK